MSAILGAFDARGAGSAVDRRGAALVGAPLRVPRLGGGGRAKRLDPRHALHGGRDERAARAELRVLPLAGIVDDPRARGRTHRRPVRVHRLRGTDRRRARAAAVRVLRGGRTVSSGRSPRARRRPARRAGERARPARPRRRRDAFGGRSRVRGGARRRGARERVRVAPRGPRAGRRARRGSRRRGAAPAAQADRPDLERDSADGRALEPEPDPPRARGRERCVGAAARAARRAVRRHLRPLRDALAREHAVPAAEARRDVAQRRGRVGHRGGARGRLRERRRDGAFVSRRGPAPARRGAARGPRGARGAWRYDRHGRLDIEPDSMQISLGASWTFARNLLRSSKKIRCTHCGCAIVFRF